VENKAEYVNIVREMHGKANGHSPVTPLRRAPPAKRTAADQAGASFAKPRSTAFISDSVGAKEQHG